MAANEIANRLRAAAWVQCGAVDGGEGIDQFSADELRYRSYVGFQNRIITTVTAAEVPLILLPLDGVLTREECAVFGWRHGTVGPLNVPTSRASYPALGAPGANYSQVFVQPFHLDWLGPDLSVPTWYPMGLLPGPQSVPTGFDLNLFNALAVLLPVVADVAQSGDFSVLVLQHPKLEGETVVETVLPVA